MRRSARAQEHRAFRDDADAIDRQNRRSAAGSSPIVVGPWLAEVGYEVLYWIPFLRWFQDAYGVQPGNGSSSCRAAAWRRRYGELAGTYVDCST
jgi:hypothetical protein